MDSLRLAVISTPRSGNCWLRHMLSQMFELDEFIVHLPDAVPWGSLPRRAILQLHWLPEPNFVSLLEEHGFRVAVACRHPLDVLISVLVFSQHDESTLRWLDGAAGDERCIAGAWPTSEAFLTYATGPRAKALLSVSARWWSMPNVCRVRYEDLVRDAAGQLAGIRALLGAAERKTACQVAANATPEHMRNRNIHMLYHVWQAQVGLWKQFLPARDARRICDAHTEVLRTLGYVCDPDEPLGQADAQAAWQRFEVAGLKRNMHGAKKALSEAAGLQGDLIRQRAELEVLSRQVSELQLRYTELQRLLALLPREHLRKLDGIGPWSLGAARTLQRLSQSFPRASRGFKSLVLLSRKVRRGAD